MKRHLLLDLACGAGGASMGYYRAGFEIIGVDSVPQPDFPFTFMQSDMFECLDRCDLSQFAVLHCSPPCPRFSLATGFHPESREKHPDYIDAIRERFIQSGKPYIIENVIGSPVERSILLCGTMFGLRVYRHRIFESNMLLFQPHHPRHRVKAAKPGTIALPHEFWCVGGHFGRRDEAQRAMGIDWMKTQKGIANAIPPAYTHYIGLQLMACLEHVEREEVA